VVFFFIVFVFAMCLAPNVGCVSGLFILDYLSVFSDV